MHEHLNPASSPLGKKLDPDTESLLTQLTEQERIKANKLPGVRTVLVVLSTTNMVYDRESLRQKILQTYPEAAVFFRTELGTSVGVEAPQSVDLLIDFSGSGRRNWFHARKLRRMARVAIGRKAGLFRGKIYDRVFDESKDPRAASFSSDLFTRERQVQREILALAGVPLSRNGDLMADRGHTIALELPPMSRL
jgi:hypothetical protein